MRRRLVLVGAAVVLALVGTFAVYSYGRGADRRAVADTRATGAVVVVRRIAAGTSWATAVKDGDVDRQQLPASSVPGDAVTDVQGAGIGTDAVAQSDIAAGQVLLRESFGTPVPQTGALSIPAGDVAISLSLSSDADVAGYVAPRSQIVVFATVASTGSGTKQTGAGQTVTRTLIPAATVLATSQAAPTSVSGDTATQTGAASGGTVLVTLALDQRDAERLVLAQQTGSLYVALRSTSSKVSAGDPGIVNTAATGSAPAHLTGA